MRRVLGWLFVVLLCCAAGEDAGVAPSDPRLQEARAALDEAATLKKDRKYAEAIPKAEHALALREAVLGGAAPEVADCLNSLGQLYRQKLDYARAEQAHLRELAIREKAFGPQHTAVAESLFFLGLVYHEQAQFSRAEPLYQRSLAIREAVLGKDHPDVAIPLNSLGNLYFERGLYSQAEALLRRALVIREQALGKDDPLVALSLNNLASVYKALGLFSQAEPMRLRALATYEKALGKDHPHVAIALQNLANLYTAQGMYERAEPLHLRALAIREQALGKDHPAVAQSLLNLADTYTEQGLYSRAEPLAQRAAGIYEKVFGEHFAGLGFPLEILATIDERQGLYSQAEALQRRVLAIREKAHGKDHPLIGNTLHNLANLAMARGAYRQAEPLYQRALALTEAGLTQHSPEVASLLTDIGRLRLAQKRLAEALPLLTRAFSLSEQRLRKEGLDFSEPRLASFLQLLRRDEERLYALLRAYPREASVQRLALAAVLLRKGRSVEELSNTSRTILLSLGPQDREAFERLRGLRTQLAALALDGPGSRSAEEYQQEMKELVAQGDALETDLAQRSAPLRSLSQLPAPEDIVGRVAASLPKDGALIEFVTYADRPLVPKPGTPEAQLPSQLRYLALVLFPDSSIRTLDLGLAAPIDRAVSRLRDALSLRDAAYQVPAQALYALAFKPLRPLLGSTRRLFLAADGQLSLTPFAALHDGKQFVLDSFDISYLTSGKDLLPRADPTLAPGPVVVLADPAFTTLPSASAAAPTPPEAQRSASLERFFSSLRADRVEHSWPALPGTRHEAEAIQHLLPQTQLFLGPDASKQRLLQLRSPSVLHIATHGFFLENAGAPAPEGSRALGAVGSTGASSRRPADPLLRSGLVLAGASAPAPGDSAASHSDSALVTALELAGMDLWGTQLVVLSACDTGRGDVKLGQGVYGLRRALVITGAETLVMSLWKVNDDSTRLLMEHFYQALLAGQGRAAALRTAMLAVRQQLPHPYSWAPFISLGSDAPLRPLTSQPLRNQ